MVQDSSCSRRELLAKASHAALGTAWLASLPGLRTLAEAGAEEPPARFPRGKAEACIFIWLGGGASGVDPELKRQMILLEVNGEHILLEFDESPDKFDERYPLVQEIFNSITFGK